MSALTEVDAGIWRWDGTDADHGFPIVGYVVADDAGLILVDPPGTSGEAAEIRALGTPAEILLTSRWHVRGAPKWAEELNIPISAPASAQDELAEAKGKADREIGEGDRIGSWRALLLSCDVTGDRGYVYEELAFWNEARKCVIIGDLFVEKDDGEIALSPNVFANIPMEAILPSVKRLEALHPKLLLSSHLGPREDVSALLQRR